MLSFAFTLVLSLTFSLGRRVIERAQMVEGLVHGGETSRKIRL